MAELTHCYDFRKKCNEKKKVLVMVNSRSMNSSFALSLWSSFDTKVCADGGANRLFDGLDPEQVAEYHPDFIIGDLDSLRQDVCDAFSAVGSVVIQDKDQEYNDLDKCLHHVASTSKGQCNKTSIVVLGGYGCRFDQEIATIHALYKWAHKFQRIVVLSEINSTELLTAGWHHRIPIDGALKGGNTCGLLPLCGKVNSITTSGLVWNLNEEFLELGQRISTSNLIAEDADEVTVVCSEDLLWTCAIQFH